MSAREDPGSSPARCASGFCESGSGEAWAAGGEADGERRRKNRVRLSVIESNRVVGDAMVSEETRDAMVVKKTGDAMVVEKICAWTGHRKAKVQSAPASEGVDMTAPVINTEPGPEQGAWQVEGFDRNQVEGYDWTEADVKVETGSFTRYFGLPDGDDDFWNFCDDQQTEELNRRLAIYHIRAYKGAELSDAQMSQILKVDGYFRPYERDPEWYFDSERCRISGFEDYQRLALRDYGYIDWLHYHGACSTLESDQQFVHLWEKLLEKTKWLQHYHKLSQEEREIMKRVTSYHAAKIRVDCLQIYSKLLCTLLEDFFYSVLFDHFYARVYFQIWKRVAKHKMNFIDAVDEVKDKGTWSYRWAQVEAEQGRDNYKRYVAHIDENLEEGEAYWLIVKAVKKFIPRLKDYYDYAKTKLEIADKMGLITPTQDLPDGTIKRPLQVRVGL